MKQIFLVLALCLGALPVAAHSPVLATEPAQGAVLASAPTDLSMTFGASVRLTKVTWSRSDGQSGTVDLSGQAQFSDAFVLPFEATDPGTYVIEWRGLSDDGHPQDGAFSFVIK